MRSARNNAPHVDAGGVADEARVVAQAVVCELQPHDVVVICSDATLHPIYSPTYVLGGPFSCTCSDSDESIGRYAFVPGRLCKPLFRTAALFR